MLTKIDASIAWLPLLAAIGCQSGKAVGYTKIDDMEDNSASFTWDDNRTGLWYSSTVCPSQQADRFSPPPYFLRQDRSGWRFELLDKSHETLPGVTSQWAARFRTVGSITVEPATSEKRMWGANINVDLSQPLDRSGGSVDASWDSGPLGSSLDGGPLDVSLDGGLLDVSLDGGLFGVSLDGGPSGVSNAGADPEGPVTAQDCAPSTRIFPGKSVDLSGFSGLVFWAKSAPSTRELSLVHRLYVILQDVNSDPRGYKCFIPPEPATKEELPDCYNGFFTTLELSDSFKRYEIEFAELTRDPTWGYHADPNDRDSLDLSKIFLLAFEVRTPKCVLDPNARCVGNAEEALAFDFWIDDLYLVKPK